MKGSDKISLKANSIAFGGRTYEVVTAYVETKGSGEGKKTARKVAGGVGLGRLSAALPVAAQVRPLVLRWEGPRAPWWQVRVRNT